MLNHFAAFDMENYGDLLYAVIFEKMLRTFENEEKIQQYSFLGGAAPQSAGFRTQRIKSLLYSPQKSPNNLIIGGGDVLQEEGLLLAGNYPDRYLRYIRNSLSIQDKILQAKIYLKKVLKRNPVNLRKLFFQKELDYPSVGPFIIDPDEYASLQSVSYCSCGAPYPFKQEIEIRRAFNHASFIYLRDELSKRKLIEAGVEKEIYVAPDLIVTLSDFFDKETEQKKGHQLLRKFGVNTDKKILCFQSFFQPQEVQDEILSQLKQFAKETNSEIALMPIGYCHLDHIFLQELAAASAGLFKYVGVFSIFDMLSVIAASNLFLGTSMHGNITAFSFGIPHIFGLTKYDKAAGFLEMVNLPSHYRVASWAEINEKLGLVSELDDAYYAERLIPAKQKIMHTFQLLLDSLPESR